MGAANGGASDRGHRQVPPSAVARAVQPKAPGAPRTPAVPPPCGGNVGAQAAQPKASGALRMPAVPPPCGGRVGAPAVQPKASGAPRMPAVPAPCGGRVSAQAVQPKAAGAPRMPAWSGAVIQRGGSNSKPPDPGPDAKDMKSRPPQAAPPMAPQGGAAAAGGGAATPAAAAVNGSAALVAGMWRDVLENWIKLLVQTGPRAEHKAAGTASTVASGTGTALGVLGEVATGGMSGGSVYTATSATATGVGALAEGADIGFSVELDVRLAQMLEVVKTMDGTMARGWVMWLYERRENPDFNGLYSAMYSAHIKTNPAALAITKSVGSKVGNAALGLVPFYKVGANAHNAHFGKDTISGLKLSINGAWVLLQRLQQVKIGPPFPGAQHKSRNDATGWMGL